MSWIQDSAELCGQPADTIESKLVEFIDLFLRWNDRIQLSSCRDRDELALRHIVDSFHLAPYLPAGSRKIVDVGSGGGFPGIMLAIARPEVEFALVESIRKKCAFLTQCRRELSLDNLTVYPERLEDFSLRFGSEFDVATSRATWSPIEWLERARPLVRSGGKILAMEGRERAELPQGCIRRPYQLGDRDRAILVMDV